MLKKMKPAKSHVSLADVAKLADCTAASVSMVLNDSPLPSARMRERVRKAAAQLGYVPNRMAQSLKRGRTFTLGVVMPYCADSYVSALLDALSLEAAEFGFQLEIHFHGWSVKEEDRALKTLGEARAEGIFLSGSRSDYAKVATLESLRKQRIPVVGMMRWAEPAFVSSIVVDRFSGAVSLGRHLAGLGHRRIDYLESVGTREAAESIPAPVQLILDGLREGSVERMPDVEIGFFQTKPEYLLSLCDIERHGLSAKSVSDLMDRFIVDYLESRSPATAVVTSHLVLAWKLLGVLAARKRRCPEDISVAGIFTEGSGALGAMPLTSAEYSVELMARKGMAVMLSAITGGKVVPEVWIPITLVERLSTAISGVPSIA